MRYIANAPVDERKMLDVIGATDMEDLFKSIPKEIRFSGTLDIPSALSEQEIQKYFRELAESNKYSKMTSFLGAGLYHHFTPSHVDQLLLRSEIYTAYTPYQPEISQGTLQTIFEFQTMICMLTGMDVANASMYDGATAAAEALLMFDRIARKKNKVVISGAIHPQYIEVCDTYLNHLGVDITMLPVDENGRTDYEKAKEIIDENTAGVLIQSPNFLGVIEDVEKLSALAHEKGAMIAVSVTEALSMALVKSPGELGADVVCGDAQSFGVPVSYGGPSIGFFATNQKFVRNMPGRLVGKTTDDQDNEGFVLTLATREQHIRRAKATSNICTNQGLIMTLVTIYLASMGKVGLRKLAALNLNKAAYLRSRLTAIAGVELAYDTPSFNEFTIRLPKAADEVLEGLKEKGIVGGLALGRYNEGWKNNLLVCATELNSKEQIDDFAAALEGLI